MDKKELFQDRKQQILSKSDKIRNFTQTFLDEYSFVETDTFSYGKRDLFGNEGFGEGVITGYGTIDGIPVCLFAQNFEVSSGGLSKGQAEKILKIQKQSQKTGSAMISVIDSAGIKMGEGINALEGYAQIIAECNKMYGEVPQIAIIKGTCNGSMSYYASLCDIVIFLENATASTASPKIIAATTDKEIKGLCSADFHLTKTGLADITVKNEEELAQVLKLVLNYLNSEEEFNPETDFNKQLAVLENGYDSQAVINNVFDKNSFIEMGKGYAGGIICGLAKIGGVTAGAILCENDENGIYLKSSSARKASRFIRFCDRFNFPLISFVNCSGAEMSMQSEQSTIITDIGLLLSAVNDFEGAKISVICNRAIGVGFTALASKSTGFDNCIAWNIAVISPIAENAGALIEYSEEIKKAKDPAKAREEAIKKYADIQADPFNAAQDGSIDNIIQPADTRQYLISMLMMLI